MSFPKAFTKVRRRKRKRNKPRKCDTSQILKPTKARKIPMAFHPAKDLEGMLKDAKTIIGFWMQTDVKNYNPNGVKFAKELIQNIDSYLLPISQTNK